jgi:hypothetical protein
VILGLEMVPAPSQFPHSQPLVETKMISKAFKMWHTSWQPQGNTFFLFKSILGSHTLVLCGSTFLMPSILALTSLDMTEEVGPIPENVTMFQAFEWYVPSDHKHWQRLRDITPTLKAIGIDTMWIPPGCKAANRDGNGYDIYDLYDLGEFDQKGSVRTKWGTKDELVEMINTANSHGIGILWDAVLNHKAAADHPEKCQAVKVDPKGMFEGSI